MDKYNTIQYICLSFGHCFLDYTVAPPPQCTEDEFRCNDGSCIDSRTRCNNNYDCRDGSDEDNCCELFLHYQHPNILVSWAYYFTRYHNWKLQSAYLRELQGQDDWILTNWRYVSCRQHYAKISKLFLPKKFYFNRFVL